MSTAAKVAKKKKRSKAKKEAAGVSDAKPRPPKKEIMHRLGADPLAAAMPWIGGSEETSSEVAAPVVVVTQPKTPGAKPRVKRVPLKSTQAGLPEGWERQTYIVKPEHREQLKHIAYWDRKTVKEVVAEAFEAYFKRWKPPIDAPHEYKDK
jgi:hypothetical protein